MSETTVGVKFVVDNEAARASGRELTQVFKENLTAVDAAGKGAESLAKDLAKVAAASKQAREDQQKANEALRTAKLVSGAFGASSKEAAAANLKAAAASETAKKSSAEAAAALHKQNQVVTQLIRDTDGKLEPGLQRAALTLKKLGAEGERTAEELHRLDLAAMAAAKGTDRLTTIKIAAGTFLGNVLSGAVSKAMSGVSDSLTGSVTAAIDFEKSFMGVTKVLGDTSAENVAAVDAGIKDLAVSLGTVPTEVAAMTAALAASGLQDDLLGYTEDAARLGTAFDLTGEQAGHAIASLTASLGLARPEMQSLLDSVNHMSDNMNATAPQLVDYLERVAGIGRAANVSGETLLALGTSIIATGIESDQAGTGVKNLLSSMEAGAKATDAQKEAFEKLGFSAVDVAQKMANGKAEETIKQMVSAIERLPNEDKFGVLISLFGKESIASVGGLATNVDLLGKSFELAGDKMSAAGSVNREFERVSQTSAHKIEKLKAQVQVLGISLGDQLLPHINKVVEFLSSPEGQTWGREAVAKTVSVVTTLADVVAAVVGGFADFTEAVGGGEKAVAALGVAALALTGPLGAAAAAGAAIGYGMAEAYDWAARKILGDTGRIGEKMQALLNEAADIRHKEHEAAMKAANEELAADQKYADQHTRNMSKAEELAQRYEAAELARLGKRATEEEKLAAFRKSRQLASAVSGNSRLLGGGTEEDRLAQFEKYVSDKEPDAPHQMSAKEKKAGAKAAKKAAREEESAEKKAAKFAMDLNSFDAEVATYSANLAKDIREQDIKSQEKAVEEAIRIDDLKHASDVERFDREKELIDASLVNGEDAAAKHEELLDRKIAADEAHARKQLELANTEERRIKALSKLEAVEHAKKLKEARHHQAEEAKIYAKRQKTIAQVTEVIGGLNNSLVEGAWKSAEGQRGALLMALGEELKATSKRFTIKGLGETAQAAIAAASYNYPGAAAHGKAALLSFGVAAAAGFAGVHSSKEGEARADKQQAEKDEAEEKKKAKEDAAGSAKDGIVRDGAAPERPSKSSSSGREEVPISYDMYKPPALGSSGGGGDTYVINLTVGSLVGTGGVQEVGQQLIAAIEEGRSKGRRFVA